MGTMSRAGPLPSTTGVPSPSNMWKLLRTMGITSPPSLHHQEPLQWTWSSLAHPTNLPSLSPMRRVLGTMGKVSTAPNLLLPLVDAHLHALLSSSHRWRWLGTMGRATPMPSSPCLPSLSPMWRELGTMGRAAPKGGKWF